MALSNARHSQSSRRHLTSFLAFIATLLIALAPTTAHGETAWRYWSYWTLEDGSWQQAMTGAADIEALDGSVQGWRYITAGIEVGQELAPRITPNFEDICEGVEPDANSARVAVVIDFGDPSDYSENNTIPETVTECVVVASGSPSSVLLPEIAELREDSGLICAINGLPSSGCGEEVEIYTDEPVLISEPADEDEASLFDNTVVLAGVALALATTAFFILKKRA